MDIYGGSINQKTLSSFALSKKTSCALLHSIITFCIILDIVSIVLHIRSLLNRHPILYLDDCDMPPIGPAPIIPLKLVLFKKRKENAALKSSPSPLYSSAILFWTTQFSMLSSQLSIIAIKSLGQSRTAFQKATTSGSRSYNSADLICPDESNEIETLAPPA